MEKPFVAKNRNLVKDTITLEFSRERLDGKNLANLSPQRHGQVLFTMSLDSAIDLMNRLKMAALVVRLLPDEAQLNLTQSKRIIAALGDSLQGASEATDNLADQLMNTAARMHYSNGLDIDQGFNDYEALIEAARARGDVHARS